MLGNNRSAPGWGRPWVDAPAVTEKGINGKSEAVLCSYRRHFGSEWNWAAAGPRTPCIATYGISPGPGAVLGFRLLGLTLIEFELINWFVRDSHDWTALRGLLIGGTAGYILGSWSSLWATLSHLMNPAGWVLVVTYAVLLLGYVYSLWAGTKKFASK